MLLHKYKIEWTNFSHAGDGGRGGRGERERETNHVHKTLILCDEAYVCTYVKHCKLLHFKI